MSFEARNALMLAKKVVDEAAKFKKAIQKAEGGAAKSKVIPHGDKKREDNLAAFLKGNHPEVPHVVYHGSSGDFKQFDPSMARSEGGAFYFSRDAFAEPGYGAKNAASYAPRRGGSIYPVHLSMKNPYITGFTKPMPDDPEQFENWMAEQEKFDRQFDDDRFKANYFRKAIANAHKNGHDGVIIKNVTDDKIHRPIFSMPSDIFVAFHPHQIKSATGNQGTFDPTNPDITKAGGGEVARKTNKIGLYSKAAEQARQLPSGSVPAAQLIGTLRNKGGIKAEELANAGITDQTGNLSPEWQSKGKIAPEDLAAHFEEHLPEIEETVLGHTIKGIPYPEEYRKIEQSILAKYKPDLERLHQINIDPSHDRETRNKALDEKEALQEKMWSEIDAAIPDRERHVEASRDKITPTKYHEYALPGGENYREVLLKLKEPEIKGKPYHIVRNETFIPALKRAGVNPQDEDAIRRSIAMKNNPRFLSDPDKEKAEAAIKKLQESGETDALNAYLESFSYNDAVEKQRNKQFQSSHWDEPNILAHIRMADRTGPNGEKILHVEEVQSDWGQKGKKTGFQDQRDALLQDVINKEKASIVAHQLGMSEEEKAARLLAYNDANARLMEFEKHGKPLPNAPYVTSTQGWTDLALKRVLKEAAEGGYDKVVWTPGEEQAKRYDLSKHIDSVKYSPAYFNPNTGNSFAGKLTAYKNGSPVINKDVMQPDDVAEIIGKDLANKLLQTEQRKGPQDFRPYHYLEGEDLSVGGEGMKDYYDNILPKRLQAVAQKHDKTAKVKYTDVMLPPSGKRGTNNPPIQAPGLDITPQMRDSILSGQEAYARGGDVMHTRKVPKPHTPVVGERQHKTRHPAMMIPGIHVVGAIHGIPYFTGKK